ncbi:hypothetical protein ACWDFH_02620 [Streptomyces kronopolitis]|uniref:hypothetical protein n=1 Tax=Streptomyces kronopolitis TaxID=1612435 RepID=UPI0036A04062
MSDSTNPPVQLGEPRLGPKPAAECDVCQALLQQRQLAEARDARVAELNAELRNHPEHAGHQG